MNMELLMHDPHIVESKTKKEYCLRKKATSIREFWLQIFHFRKFAILGSLLLVSLPI